MLLLNLNLGQIGFCDHNKDRLLASDGDPKCFRKEAWIPGIAPPIKGVS